LVDFLLVGSGLFNAVFAHEAAKRGKTCRVVEVRDHIGGNCYTQEVEGIQTHMYGAHIFRTSRKDIWDYMRGFAEFNHFINAPIANYRGEIYNLPFNMNTFSKMWNISTPEDAKTIIARQSSDIRGEARNLEEHAIQCVGRDIYEKLIREYTEKQWGRPCAELPASIIRRLPIRFTYDNNYFNDPYQGIPVGGYTRIIEQMFSDCEITVCENFLNDTKKHRKTAHRVIYTGAIDAYFNYKLGPLEYRSLRFEHVVMDTGNYQGVAVMNFTGLDVPYTRIIEHKHFEFGNQPKTVISREYSCEWSIGIEPYYPINNEKNEQRYRAYAELVDNEEGVSFCGRLGTYKYTDMQDTVINALEFAKKEFK